MSHALDKAEILRGNNSFLDVFERGTSIETTHLRGIFSIEHYPDVSLNVKLHVGFAIRRGLLNAVYRNRVKRLMRESFRLHKASVSPGLERVSGQVGLVFLYSPKAIVDARELSLNTIEHDVKLILLTLEQRLIH